MNHILFQFHLKAIFIKIKLIIKIHCKLTKAGDWFPCLFCKLQSPKNPDHGSND
jgi:hypothetical protein